MTFQHIIIYMENGKEMSRIIHEVNIPTKTQQPEAADEILPPDDEPTPIGRKTIAFEDIDANAEICTIQEACNLIGISRTTLAAEREKGRLIDIKKGEKDVRFFLKEVLWLKNWYALYKGKTNNT